MNQQYKRYLDNLQESAKVNMYGAVPYLMAEFDLDKKEAKKVLLEWMNNYK
jgi:hypothetical protein